MKLNSYVSRQKSSNLPDCIHNWNNIRYYLTGVSAILDVLQKPYWCVLISGYCLYYTIMCLKISCVWQYHVFENIMCLTISCVWKYHVFENIICCSISCVWEYHMSDSSMYLTISRFWQYCVFNIIMSLNNLKRPCMTINMFDNWQ